ncbi:hypothetical protein ACOMHN_023673 [Nucella lapillus]
MYVGETCRSLAERFSEHLRSMKLGYSNPVGQHFASSYHSFSHANIAAVWQNPRDRVYRKHMESRIISRLGTTQPAGMNVRNRIPNKEVLARAGIHSMFALLTKRRVRWLGHVIRMQDGTLPKDILYDELATGSRPTGRLVLRYKDVCKRDFKAGGIAPADFEALAADRSSRQLATRSAIKTPEQWREEK